jgi:hypothetical protein
MKVKRLTIGTFIAGMVGALALLAALLLFQVQGAHATADINLLAVDTNPTAAPANTATSLGSIEPCKSFVAAANQVFDIDVVVDSTPAMAAFGFDLIYNPAVLKVTALNVNLLLNSTPPAGAILHFTDATPDADGDFQVGEADLGGGLDGGAGVLARITMQVVGVGVSTLDISQDPNFLGNPYVNNSFGNPYSIGAVHNGEVRVGSACATATDVKLISTHVTAPASATVNTPFNVTIDAVVHNNGPFGPVNTHVTEVLSMPGDCSAAGGPTHVVPMTLPVSLATAVPQQSFTVTCTTASAHNFSATATNAITSGGITDTTSGNDSASAVPATTNITTPTTATPTPTHRESKVQDANTKFFGVFVGTDGTGDNLGAEIDPCRFDRAVGQWPGADAQHGWHASRTTVLTEAGFTGPPCDALLPDTNYGAPNGRATEAAFRAAIAALQPGGVAADKPHSGDELVVFISAHGLCAPPPAKLILDSTGNTPNTDGTVADTNLRDILSGFPASVTITVILDICHDGFAGALMDITDDLGRPLDLGHIEVMQSSRLGEGSSGGFPVVDAGHNYTTAIVDCFAISGGKTVADAKFGNSDGKTWSLEMHNCVGALTTLITAYCTRGETDARYIADKSFGNNDGTMTAAETSKCALDSWLGGPASVKALIKKAQDGPQGVGRKQHPTFKELGNPDKDPNNPDIDGDGISNVDEMSILDRVTNLWNPDTDGDGLPDKAEDLSGCDSVDPDTDGDGVIDGEDPDCLPVGGIAELSVSGSGPSVPWTPLTVVAASVMATLGVGLWYSRRRWSR